MPTLDEQRSSVANTLRSRLAPEGALTANQARLFSQAVRIGWGGVGLQVWTMEHRAAQLADARRLLEGADIFFQVGDPVGAQALWRRAGDIFEWLSRSRPQQQPVGERFVPLALLGAAAFQLAGLPAMAASLLASAPSGEPVSRLLASFVRADFGAALGAAVDFWQHHEELTRPAREIVYNLDSPEFLTAELVRCVGLIAATLRANDQQRLKAALRKLGALARLAVRSRFEYFWLVMELVSQVALRFSEQSLWNGVGLLENRVSEEGRNRLFQFTHSMFEAKRGLLWPSQREGVARLAQGGSFALCTPTGSGKTTVAELALLDALYGSDVPEAPLAFYVVPSRALAAEVEARLANDLGHIDSRLSVTSLYGGAEWSLTDAWVTSDGPSILVCTVEMGETLLRYLGPLLLPRLVMLVVDEAHQVQFSPSERSLEYLRQAEHRGARLEQFVARVFASSPGCRALGLSAVAGGIESTIARWFSRGTDAEATGTSYRSTRQLIGALECHADGGSKIRLERLDGRSLGLVGREDTAYVPMPFDPMPAVTGVFRGDVGRFARAHALWAAIQTARAGRTVLISVTRDIETIVADYRTLLETQRAWRDLDESFARDEAPVLYAAALQACGDYCGEYSNELCLLQRGIAVHHGQLPILVRRLMTEVIRAGVTPITVATSTLTEGVNLPFDVVLVPSIVRKQFVGLDEQGRRRYDWPVLPAAEFLNLAGRAGRPGGAGEGMTLVMLPVEITAGLGTAQALKQQRDLLMHKERFRQLMNGIERNASAGVQPDSPLARLLDLIFDLWRSISPAGTEAQFLEWLESANRPGDQAPAEGTGTELSDALDSLDLVLLGAISEAEVLKDAQLEAAELEVHLQRVWSSTFARFASQQHERLGQIFVRRGMALPTQIYPGADVRRELYRLGLPPKKGSGFMVLVGQIEEHLRGLTIFPDLIVEERFEFVNRLASLVHHTPGFEFRVSTEEGWSDVLRWWLMVPGARSPAADEVQTWLRMATQEFEFRLGTAVGASMAAIWNRISGQQLELPSLDEWKSRTGMGWSALWLRELLAWGTLEPLVAYLVATRREATRVAAAERVLEYQAWFDSRYPRPNQDEMFHPLRMRAWALEAYPIADSVRPEEIVVPVALEGDFPDAGAKFSVFSLLRETNVDWLDAAGYVLARSERTQFDATSGVRQHGILDLRGRRVIVRS